MRRRNKRAKAAARIAGIAALGLAAAPAGLAGAVAHAGGTGGAKGTGTHQAIEGPYTSTVTTCTGTTATVTFASHVTYKISGPTTTSVSFKTNAQQIGAAIGSNGDSYEWSSIAMLKAVHLTPIVIFGEGTPTATGKGSSGSFRQTFSLTDLTTGAVTQMSFMGHLTFNAAGTLTEESFSSSETMSC